MAQLVRIGDVLHLPNDRFGRRLRPILALIDSVHGLATPHRLPVRITRNRDNEGEYHYRGGSHEPDHIEVSRINSSMEATLLHEVGHFLELAVLPGCSYGQRQWSGPTLTADWLDAVEATAAFRALRAIVTTGQAPHIGPDGHPAGMRDLGPGRLSWVRYLLTPRELWARSYAQWVARRGRDEALQRFLEQYGYPGSVFPLQWSGEDFAAVAEQFDRLFLELGWLR